MAAKCCTFSTREEIIQFVNQGLKPLKDPENSGHNGEQYAVREEEENEEMLPITMHYLTPKMKEEAKNALHETEEIKQKSLDALKKLISEEQRLNCRVDENFLLQFLRARKFDLKKAFKLLQGYYKYQGEFADLLNNTDSENVFDIMLKGYIGLMKRRDKNGCSVFIIKGKQWDPEIDDFNDVFASVIAGMLWAIEDCATQVCGWRAIIDLRDITWKQIKFCTPMNMAFLARSIQFVFPGRIKGVHVICSHRIFKIAFAVIYPFLTRKLKTRVHVHGEDVSGLQEYISPLVLAEEFGGEAGPFTMDGWKEYMIRHEKLVRWMLTFGYK